MSMIRTDVWRMGDLVMPAILAVALGACGGAAATSPQIVYVYVSPTPMPSVDPTAVPTADIRPAWFAGACDAGRHLANASDAWSLAIASPSADEAAQPIYTGRNELDEARSILAELPAWEGAGDFPTVALTFANWLDRGFDEAEIDPRGIRLEMLYEWSDRLSDLRAAAGGARSGSMGCGLNLLF